MARQAGLVGNLAFENLGGAGGTVLTNRAPVGLKDVTPIARMTAEPGFIVVPAQSDIRDIAGLLAALREAPGRVSVAGGSAGGTDHIVPGQILRALGREAREGSCVAFAGGGPAPAAILGAQLRAGISGRSEFAEPSRAGRMRALATTGATRSDPNLPTLRGAGVEVVASNWRGGSARRASTRRSAQT